MAATLPVGQGRFVNPEFDSKALARESKHPLAVDQLLPERPWLRVRVVPEELDDCAQELHFWLRVILLPVDSPVLGDSSALRSCTPLPMGFQMGARSARRNAGRRRNGWNRFGGYWPSTAPRLLP